MFGGLLSGIMNPISSGFTGLFGADTFNPFKKIKRPHPNDFATLQEYEVASADYEANQAQLSQFQEATMGLGKEKPYKTPSMLNVGMGRPSMKAIEESPYGAPLDINLPGGNVPPGPSTPGTFGSMESLMQRADLLNQLKKKRVF